jgi:hypothetical protein
MSNLNRKTIQVGKVLNMANYFLASDNTSQDERQVVAQFLESILFQTGNYRGFRYLPDDKGESNGASDGTRRSYFVSEQIREDAEKDLSVIHRIK